MAHGLDGTLVEPDWPPLTLDEIRGILREYPALGPPKRILMISPRPLSAASVVATQSQNVFIKRHHMTVRDTAGLREEHRFMAHLRSQGATVPRVFRAASGETAIKVGEWVYEVHETPRGIDVYEDALSWTPFRSLGHARSAGQVMAQLHLASRGFDAPARKSRPLVAGFTIFATADAGAEFSRYVAARPALSDYLRHRNCREEALALLAPFHAELLPLLPRLTPLWTHNDLHASNLLWSDPGGDAEAVAVIDFGLCDRTNAVHDLAQAIERNIVGWLSLVDRPDRPEDVRVHYDHLFALLDGYESARPLAREERRALAPMTALCHAEFALSETDYFLTALHAKEKARMACEGYLVSHARWFAGPGRMLLDALREWASKPNHQPAAGDTAR
jgi:Ser/Thr protein kinase RdoA (MazF antagonist)